MVVLNSTTYAGTASSDSLLDKVVLDECMCPDDQCPCICCVNDGLPSGFILKLNVNK